MVVLKVFELKTQFSDKPLKRETRETQSQPNIYTRYVCILIDDEILLQRFRSRNSSLHLTNVTMWKENFALIYLYFYIFTTDINNM